MEERQMELRVGGGVLKEVTVCEALNEFKAATMPLDGARNRGNTCYVNSVLQCLLKGTPLGVAMVTNKRHMCDKAQPCYVCWVASLAASGMQAPVMSDVCANVATLGNLRRYQQEDAHEFYRKLLDTLHLSYYNTYILEAQVDRCVALEHTTLPHRLFSGWLQSEVTCGSCKKPSKVYQPFMDISVPLLPSVSTVEKGLHELFGKSDHIAEYQCDHCKQAGKAGKRVTIHKLPPVVVVQLQRFQHTAFGTRKNDQPVGFSASIDFGGYIKNANLTTPTKYHLSACVCHYGVSANSGHYTSFVSQRGVWVSYDDSRVRETCLKDVLRLRPYLIFYLREDCMPAALSDPPRPAERLLAPRPPPPVVAAAPAGATGTQAQWTRAAASAAATAAPTVAAATPDRRVNRPLHPSRPVQPVQQVSQQTRQAVGKLEKELLEERRLEKEKASRARLLSGLTYTGRGVPPERPVSRKRKEPGPEPLPFSGSSRSSRRRVAPPSGNSDVKLKSESKAARAPQGPRPLELSPAPAPPQSCAPTFETCRLPATHHVAVRRKHRAEMDIFSLRKMMRGFFEPAATGGIPEVLVGKHGDAQGTLIVVFEHADDAAKAKRISILAFEVIPLPEEDVYATYTREPRFDISAFAALLAAVSVLTCSVALSPVRYADPAPPPPPPPTPPSPAPAPPTAAAAAGPPLGAAPHLPPATPFSAQPLPTAPSAPAEPLAPAGEVGPEMPQGSNVGLEQAQPPPDMFDLGTPDQIAEPSLSLGDAGPSPSRDVQQPAPQELNGHSGATANGRSLDRPPVTPPPRTNGANGAAQGSCAAAVCSLARRELSAQGDTAALEALSALQRNEPCFAAGLPKALRGEFTAVWVGVSSGAESPPALSAELVRFLRKLSGESDAAFIAADAEL